MNVPFLDLKTQNSSLKQEILADWERILENASFIGGEYVERFEEDFAQACNTSHCVGVGSGTDALRFIFIALGLEPGDEVITVPNTFIATTEAISQAGGKAVFVDVDSATYNIDPSKIESAITPRTKGIVPVHLYGCPADMDALHVIAQKHNLWVVEDACQAHLAEYKGKRAGSLANAAAFSFYPGKNLGGCGEGGAVTTNDKGLSNKIQMLRDHGQSKKYHHEVEGYNGRLDALQAAALTVKLRHLPAWTAARRRHATQYREYLSSLDNIVLPFEPEYAKHVYHLFVILINNRDLVLEQLQEKGITAGLHYPVPLHLQKAYSHGNQPSGSFPVTEGCAERLLSLPMYAELSDEQINYVCTELKNCI